MAVLYEASGGPEVNRLWRWLSVTFVVAATASLFLVSPRLGGYGLIVVALGALAVFAFRSL
jgi:hypothetical protein